MLEILAHTVGPTITGLDVVREVSEFFYIAWGMLVVLLGIVGAIVPWWISRAQRRAFENREKTLHAEIQSARTTAARDIEGLREKSLQALDRMKVEIKAEIEWRSQKATGLIWANQALSLKGVAGRTKDAKFFTLQVMLHLTAAEHFAQAAGADEESQRLLWQQLKMAVDKVHRSARWSKRELDECESALRAISEKKYEPELIAGLSEALRKVDVADNPEDVPG